MKYCEKCGNKMADDSLFCSKCGRKVADAEITEKEEKTDENEAGNISNNITVGQEVQSNVRTQYPAPYQYPATYSDNVPAKKKSGRLMGCAVIFIVFIIFCAIVGSCVANQSNSSGSTSSNHTRTYQESVMTEEEFKASCAKNISYEQVARRPQDYNGKKAAFYGVVQQVIEESGNNITLKVCIPDGKWELAAYNNYFWVEYKKPYGEARILVDDKIEMYGYLRGTVEARLLINDQPITVPKFEAKYIDIRNYGGQN